MSRSAAAISAVERPGVRAVHRRWLAYTLIRARAALPASSRAEAFPLAGMLPAALAVVALGNRRLRA